MGKVLWILGAGASLHMGFSLIRNFTQFFEDIWFFRDMDDGRTLENQDPRRGLEEILPKAIGIMRAPVYKGRSIEQLLTHPRLSHQDKIYLKKAISRCFERRTLGRLFKLISSTDESPRPKLEHYSRLLCLVESGDVIVNFNYDPSLETVMSVVHKDRRTLNFSELNAADWILRTESTGRMDSG